MLHLPYKISRSKQEKHRTRGTLSRRHFHRDAQATMFKENKAPTNKTNMVI